jgi:sugar phosphate isomerase/epimerase
VAAGALLGLRGAIGAEAPGTGPRIRLGMVTYMIGAKMDLETLIGVCEKAKIEGVELRTTHAHGVEPSLDAAGRAKVKERFAKTSVVLRALGSACEYHAADAAAVKKNIEQTNAFVQLAADLGVWGVKVRPNGLRKDVPEEQTLRQIGEAIRECGEFAKEKGVAIVVECHGAQTAHPPRMAKIMEFCKHPSVGLCWNSNGGEAQNGSIRENFKICQPWIRHCHVRTITLTDYPWAELYALLKEMKYDGFTMLETTCKGDPVEFLNEQRAAFEKMTTG